MPKVSQVLIKDSKACKGLAHKVELKAKEELAECEEDSSLEKYFLLIRKVSQSNFQAEDPK